MPHKAKVVAITKANAKLWNVARINKGVEQIIGHYTKGRALLDMVSLQTLLHAEKHGDVMPAARLVEGLRGSGLVIAAIMEWYKKYSPIRLTFNAETKKVEGKLLKEDEEGYKPFNTGEAEEHPAMDMKEAVERQEKPLAPVSIKFLTDKILGFKKLVAKAVEKDGRGVEGDLDTINAFINVVETAAITYRKKIVKPVPAKEQPKAEAA